MKIDGTCHCGSISYEAEADPSEVLICHCTDCQTLSGSAFRTVVFVKESSFKLLSGTLKTYVKMPDSGKERAQTFCPECGTPIYSAQVAGRPRSFGVRVGTVRQRESLIPSKQYWCRSAHSWTKNIGPLEEFETQEDWI